MSIPTSWPTGTAYAQLETYTDDSYSSCVGTEVYSFTITVDPASVVPTAGTLSVALVQPATIPASWGVYVKGYSTAKLTLSGSSPGSGSSYKNVLLSCGSQQKSSQSETTFTTDALMETGMLTCKAKITNAYGNAASATDKTITVYDYFSPIFASLAAYRCTSNGTPSDTGAYISVTASVTIASVNGKKQSCNAPSTVCSCRVRYMEHRTSRHQRLRNRHRRQYQRHEWLSGTGYGNRRPAKSVWQLLSNDRYRTNLRPCYFLHGRRAERQYRYAGHETARCANQR